MSNKLFSMNFKYYITAILYCALLSFESSGQTNKTSITHGPYLQNVGVHNATVFFATDQLVLPALRIGFPDGSEKIVQNSTDGLFNVDSGIQKIRIKGLEPGKRYTYRLELREIVDYHPYKCIFGETIKSKKFSFITLDEKKEKVNFTVFNDSHDKAEKIGQYLYHNDIEKQDFYFLNGDILGHIESEEQIYSSFLDTCVSLFASEKPFFYVRGNHETRGQYARKLKNYLDLPEDHYYYAFTHAGVRFVILDGGEDKKDDHEEYSGLANFDPYRSQQLDWLKKEVSSEDFKNARVRIVVIHMPVYKDEKNWYGMQQLADHYGPVLQSAGIDLMLSGHKHRNIWRDAEKSGFNYPVLVGSHNHFIEAEVKKSKITVKLKDLQGEIVEVYSVKTN